MFDLRSFTIADLYRCSADLRALGEAVGNEDAAQRIVEYLFEHLRHPDTSQPECVLVRIFETRTASSLSEDEVRALGAEVDPSTSCLALRASRGVNPEWNAPALSRRHRVIPLTPRNGDARTMPMVTRLMSDLGVPTHLSRSSGDADDRAPLFDVFHVQDAAHSPFVPDQEDFVVPYGIQSVLGFGGMIPPARVFIVVLFSTVRIPRTTAKLFRTLAPSVGLALLTPELEVASLKACIRSYEIIVRHHENVALRDHRQLRRYAQQLTTSLQERRRFEALVDNSSDFIGIASPEGKVLYLNPAGRRLAGLPADSDVSATHLADYFAPECGAQLLEETLPKTLAEGQWAGDALLCNRTTHALLPVSSRTFTIHDAQAARLLGIGVVLRDVSEQRRASEERERLLANAQEARAAAQAASRAKDEFLASLGHELRNPLSPILTAVELMELRGAKSRERDVIERQALHLARLVDDLLDVARIGRGQLEVHKQPVELSVVVRRAAEIVGPAFARQGQRLVVDVPERGLVVNADTGRLAQVVSNLLDNASKYSPPGAEVTVRAVRTDGHVELRVRDRGVGIPKEMLDTIFESFVQHRRDGARTPGLGLGLAIVRNLVALHDGKVRAHSEGPGKGSELIVTLPLLEVEGRTPASPAPPKASRRYGGRGGKRILVVDDNEDAALVLRDALDALGHEVAVAKDGVSALALAAELRPDVALLDIGLPGMSGYELARRIRGVAGVPPELRLVAVSGFGQQEDRARSLEAGFVAHLVKPVRLEALMSAVGAPSA